MLNIFLGIRLLVDLRRAGGSLIVTGTSFGTSRTSGSTGTAGSSAVFNSEDFGPLSSIGFSSAGGVKCGTLSSHDGNHMMDLGIHLHVQ